MLELSHKIENFVMDLEKDGFRVDRIELNKTTWDALCAETPHQDRGDYLKLFRPSQEPVIVREYIRGVLR